MSSLPLSPVSIDDGSSPERSPVSLSTTFFPEPDKDQDLILLSSDNVLFYVQSQQLFLECTSFSPLPPESSDIGDTSENLPVIAMSEPSPIISLVLHAAHNIPCSHLSCSEEEIYQTFDTLRGYGFSLKTRVVPNSVMYNLVLSRASTSPIHMYALAAKYDLEELAVAVSPHLLSFDLSRITDEFAIEMGAVYLRRLMFLHLGRIDALKRLLSPPVPFHTFSHDCGVNEWSQVMGGWCTAVAELAAVIRPDLSPVAIEIALGPISELSSCPVCKAGMNMTIEKIITAWANVKATI